jgi:hypothetical protein
MEGSRSILCTGADYQEGTVVLPQLGGKGNIRELQAR